MFCFTQNMLILNIRNYIALILVIFPFLTETVYSFIRNNIARKLVIFPFLTETVNSFRAISENQYKHILCETKRERLDKIRCVIRSITFEAIT